MDASRKVIEVMCTQAGVAIDGQRPWDLKIHNQDFYDRVLRDGALGLGETYMLGWWDSDDLFAFFKRILPIARAAGRKNAGWRTALASIEAHIFNLQTRDQARDLADAHYNISNELFEHMLGPSMAYSCGYWAQAITLDDAQASKYELICRKLQLRKGERLLDIGCGWGGFAKYAAQTYDVDVVGVTVAEEQAQYARSHCKELPIEIVACDYREFDSSKHGGPFDKVASIGMIEHVGYRNYPTLYAGVHNALRDGGLFLLHTIGSNVSMETADAWLATYIFPGGVIPSIRQLGEAAEERLVLHDLQNIGTHYTPTLRAWHNNFEAYWSGPLVKAVRPQVWDSEDVFYRMWRYYLLGCAADFAVGDSQVWQLVYAKGHLPDGYARGAVTINPGADLVWYQ